MTRLATGSFRRAAGLVALAASLGCGGGGDWLPDEKRDERVQVSVASSPSGLPIKGSVTGENGSTVSFLGVTPFSTELVVEIGCKSGCSLGGIVYVNDPDLVTRRPVQVTFCLVALDQRNCVTGDFIVTASIPP